MFKRKREERKRKREMERKKGRENWLIMSAIYSQKLEVEWTVVSKEGQNWERESASYAPRFSWHRWIFICTTKMMQILFFSNKLMCHFLALWKSFFNIYAWVNYNWNLISVPVVKEKAAHRFLWINSCVTSWTRNDSARSGKLRSVVPVSWNLQSKRKY